MTTYKATDVQGRSFADTKVTWAVGETTTHPTSTTMVPNDVATYLSASVEPADCTGFRWPCRLFEVEPVGDCLDGLDYPHKRAALAFRVVRELDAFEALGPNGEAVAKLIERTRRLTAGETARLDAAWDAAWDAARALLVKDKITPEQFATLTKPWRDAGLEL
jgi:hypothetical protein